jgi:hypothetical protein
LALLRPAVDRLEMAIGTPKNFKKTLVKIFTMRHCPRAPGKTVILPREFVSLLPEKL